MDIITHRVQTGEIHLVSHTGDDGCECVAAVAGAGTYDLGFDARPRLVVCVSGSFVEEEMNRMFSDMDPTSSQLILDPGQGLRIRVKTAACFHIWIGRAVAA